MTFLTHPEGIAELERVKSDLCKLWLPPPETGISEWASAHRILPAASGRPGPWVPDPIQREIEQSCCDPTVREVVFYKATRLGWSEICNNTLGWAIDVHGMSMLMLQPSRETAEQYCKERLDEMIESTPILNQQLRISSSKKAGSTTRYKQFTNGGSFFVASAGNPRELRSRRARLVIEDEVDGYEGDVEDEGDPDSIVRRRGDEFYDFRMLIGSTPALPSGVSRIENTYNRSSRGIYLNPCPHCNAMEPFLWRDPEQHDRYLLRYEKDSDNKVIRDSVLWTCIRCGAAIEEKWKVPMMEAGHWKHRRPAVKEVKGYWANGLYSMASDHWVRIAQEWVDAHGDKLKTKAFINLHLAETFNEPGESIEPSFLRRRADQEKRPRAIVPDGTALLLVQVDVQTGGTGRLEAQVVGITPDERAFLVEHQIFAGDPLLDEVWEDLDAWLLAGWAHERGARMSPHLVLVDARDGNTRDAVYRFCAPRAPRWVFPQMGMESIGSKGWAEESSSKKSTIRMFLTSTDTVKRTLFSRINLDPAGPRSIHLAEWVSDEYIDQLGGEKRVPYTDPKTRATHWRWMKTRPRNEALDLWVYALSGWWIITKILAPHLGGPDGLPQLQALATAASEAKDSVTYTQGPGRRIRSHGSQFDR